MKFKIAINGFGETTKNILRSVYFSNIESQFEIVAINHVSSSLDAVHSLIYESPSPRLTTPIGFLTDGILINHKKIPYFSESDPSQLPWEKLELDWLIDCTNESSVIVYSREQLVKHH